MKIHTYKDMGGIDRQLILNDDGKHKIVAGNIVLKTTVELRQDTYDKALADCLELRHAAYALLNQDEMRFDDMMNGTTIWKDTILSIKAKYPKPVL